MMRSLFTLEISTAIKRRFQHRLAEWHLAFIMMTAGLMLLFTDTFDLPPYDMVKQIAPQYVWAIVMLLAGGGRLVVLVINGAFSRSPHLRAGLASFSSFIWTAMLAGLFTFHEPLLVGPFILGAVVFDVVNAFRAAQDARLEDEESGAKNGIPG